MTKVSRRTFLKTLAAGTFTIATGIGFGQLGRGALSTIPITTGIRDGDWIIDTAKRTISYNGKGNSCTIMELYRSLMERWDDMDLIVEEIPMSRITDQIYELTNEWRIPDVSVQFLKGGSLSDQYGNLWSHFVTVGEIDEGSRLGIIADGEPAVISKSAIRQSGQSFETIIKTKENDKQIVDRVEFRVRQPGRIPTEFILTDPAVSGTLVAPIYTGGVDLFQNTTLPMYIDRNKKVLQVEASQWKDVQPNSDFSGFAVDRKAVLRIVDTKIIKKKKRDIDF
jgi:hypothetical protein